MTIEIAKLLNGIMIMSYKSTSRIILRSEGSLRDLHANELSGHQCRRPRGLFILWESIDGLQVVSRSKSLACIPLGLVVKRT